jgi:uncharacterized repeat protein (TIGR02543 family)
LKKNRIIVIILLKGTGTMRKRVVNGICGSVFVLIMVFSACENDIINDAENDIPIVDHDSILGVWRSLTPVEKTPEETDFLFIHFEETEYRISFHDKNGFYDPDTPLIPYVIDAGGIKYISSDNTKEDLPLKMEARGEQRLLRLSYPIPIHFERIHDPANPIPVIYRVFYDANNASSGSAPVDETEYTSGATVILAGQEDLFRTGYLFGGWSKKEDGEADHQPGDEITLEDQGITLYAVWIKRPENIPTYTITYDGNGYTSNPETVPRDTNTYAEGDPVRISLPDKLVKTGYAFVGWNTLEDGTGTPISAGDIIECGNKNITLYAIWSTFTFKIITVDGISSLSITGYMGTDSGIVIPEYINSLPVTAIDDGAFDNSDPGNDAKRLTSVTLPPTITTIGGYAFADNRLTEIILPGELTSIGRYAFYNNQLAEIRIPDKVRTIGERAFLSNELTTIYLGEQITSLGDHQVFAENLLTSVTIPPGIASLGIGTFDRNDLISITLGADLTIASGALGTYDAAFRTYYTANGSHAGTYVYNTDHWEG